MGQSLDVLVDTRNLMQLVRLFAILLEKKDWIHSICIRHIAEIEEEKKFHH